MFNLLETLCLGRRVPYVEHGPSWKTHSGVRLSLERLEVRGAAPRITDALEDQQGAGQKCKGAQQGCNTSRVGWSGLGSKNLSC